MLRRFCLPLLVSLAASTTPVEPLRLPPVFADGMVAQRDKPLVIWGWAGPGDEVAVEFRGRSTRAKVASSGQWTASLPAGSAGGPFSLTVLSGAERVVLRDVLVGDVWVASGQSNMEFQLGLVNDAENELARANDTLVRQFKVPVSWANDPDVALAGGSWTRADSSHAAGFSAVAYYFARELRKSVGVPIGIINTTWPGSNIETWLSRGAQHISDSTWASILRADEQWKQSIRDSLRAKLGELPERDAGLNGDRALWADPLVSDSGWADIPVPSYWESRGYPGMDGIAWYRTTFELDSAQAREGVTLSIAAIDDDDIAWVNGVEVGRTSGYNVQRSYRVPATAVHAGRNVLAIRVADGGGGGGINGDVMLLYAGGRGRLLTGTWKFRVGAVTLGTDGQHINKIPTVAYNKMVHPILPLSIKGVIWYQGESNANNMEQARAYRGQFTTLIESWRHEWGAGKDVFPFLWVQLPNFGMADTMPPLQSAWATQRESMDAALSLPNTGRAITIDVGDPNDIHPRNKQDPGVRLARVALRTVYGKPVVSSGPTYRSHTTRGDTIVIQFTDVAQRLRPRSGEVGGFAIAGADHRFAWANARIDGSRVFVWSPAVTKPVAVRYAWANNPDRANLYNSEGLPAAPFRTDRW